jgi:hypothetical protein
MKPAAEEVMDLIKIPRIRHCRSLPALLIPIYTIHVCYRTVDLITVSAADLSRLDFELFCNGRLNINVGA